MYEGLEGQREERKACSRKGPEPWCKNEGDLINEGQRYSQGRTEKSGKPGAERPGGNKPCFFLILSRAGHTGRKGQRSNGKPRTGANFQK